MKRLFVACLAAATAFSVSATNYYWCGAGEPNPDGSRNWEDPANWLIEGSRVVTAGYPGISDSGAASTGDQAWFANKTTDDAVVKLSRKLTIGYLYLHTATTPVTLIGGTTTNDVLTLNNDFNCDTASYPVTLDHIGIYRSGNVTMGANRALTLKNGANLHVNNFTFKSGTTVTLKGGAYMRSNSFTTVADGGNTLTLEDGSVYRCESGITLAKDFSATLTGGSQWLFQNAAGTGFYNLMTYSAVNTISLSGRSLIRCNEFWFGYPGQVITIDDSTIDVRYNCLIGNTVPGGGEMVFKGAAPKFSARGNTFRVQKNDAGMNVPFVFRYFVPEGGYAEPPFQYLYDTTTACFGSWTNPTRLTKFVVDTASPAYTAGTQTKTALAYSTSGFYWKAKANYTDVSDTSTGSIYFTDGEGNTGVTTDLAAKYIRATIGTGSPAPVPEVAESKVDSVLTVAVNRKTLTATASVTQKSTVAARTVITLYAGLTAATAEAVVTREIPAAGAYELVWTAPDDMFEKNYVHWVVVTDYDAQGQEIATSTSGQKTAKTLDTTTYTWTGKGREGDWTDPANWSDNQSGNCLHWPGTAGATAYFPVGTKATFVITSNMTVGQVNMNTAGTELTFVPGEGVTTNSTKWSFNGFNPCGNDTKVTIDGVAMYLGGISGGNRSRIVIRNGANVYSGDVWLDTSGVLELTGDSWLCCNQFGLGGGDSLIEDSTLYTRSHDSLGRKTAGGSLTFRGTHPIWWHNNKDGYLYSNLANAGYQINFSVPVGGYAVAPIRAISTQLYKFGDNGKAAGSSAYTINILDDSPANRTDATVETTLVSWPKGINKSLALEGALPDDGCGTDDAFVWSGEADPKTLSVRIVGSTHANALQVSGSPEAISSSAVSPAYGFTTVASGDSVTCSAPADYVQVSDTKRAKVVGWKLYAVDAATHERTLVSSGKENTCSYTNEDGLWHVLEWQWRVEYLVTATSTGNGTAAVKEAWVETGTKAYFTVTPDDGYGFFKWTGDIPADRDKTTDLFITVRDRAYALTANFLPTVIVSSTDGELADQVAKNAGKVILLPDELYEVKKQIVVGANTIVRGDRAKGDEPVVKAINRISTDITAPSSIFKLTHADASIQGLAITTDWPNHNIVAANNYDYARGVWLEGAGLVDHCVITNCRTLYVNTEGGGGVFLNGGGIVRNTKIIDCRTYASGGNNAQGHAAFLKAGGLLETCEIRKCGIATTSSAVPSSSTAVMLTGGTVRNCLIADCSQGHDGATMDGTYGVGVKISAAAPCAVDNCTIVGNFMKASSKTVGFHVYYTDAATKPLTFRNNIVWDNVNSLGVQNWFVRNNYPYTSLNNCTTPKLGGTDEIDDNPAFADAANGDYTLTYTASVDSALYLDWMDDVLDLAGNERCIGVAPDRGCYEFKPNGLVCGFTVAQEGALDVDKLTLKASVLGDTEGIVYTWTLVDQDGKTIVTNGADLATVVLNAGVGRYSVALAIQNGAGEKGGVVKANCAEVFPSQIYVATDGTAVYPYASFETGATSVRDAISAAADGSTIHVADGTYRESETITIVKGVRLVSENGPDKTTIHARAQVSSNPMLLLGHANATVSGITLSGIGADGKRLLQWGALKILADGGTVTNCWIRDNETVSISVCGAGARLEGGTVVDCLFSNNWTSCSGGAGMKGGAVHMTGANALVDRCRILNNQVSYGSAPIARSNGGGVYLNAGLVRNCFIDGNFAQDFGGGAAVEGSGVLQNCTVVRNSSKSGNGGIWQNGNGKVVDCLAWNNDVNGAAEDVDDPGFVDAVHGDFHLNSASAGVDAGTAADPGACDLDLLPRVSGKKADKGCFEYDQSQFAIGIGYEKLSPFAPGTIRFSAVANPEGTELDEDNTWWTFDGSEPSEYNYAERGTVVEREFGTGFVSVRFKTVYQGKAYAIDKPDWFAYYGEKVYVSKDAENPEFPYATPETATADYTAGMEALQENATIIFGEGTWTLPKTFTLGKACTVVGAGPGKTVIDQQGKDWTTAQAFVLAHPGATVSGITFMNAKSWNPGGSISMTAGTVTNCSFVNCFAYNGSSGGAVSLSNGLLVDCTFTDCGSRYYNTADSVSKGTVVYASGKAVVDRCVVTGARNLPGTKAGNSNFGDGAVALVQAWVDGVNSAPTLRNTVVAGSVLAHCGGVVTCDRAYIENCTIVGNASTNTVGKIGGLRHDGTAAPSVVNTVVWNNTCMGAASETGGLSVAYDTCLIGVDPKLRGSRKCAYAPTGSSPCVNAARTLDWMDGAKDVYGRPRVKGRAADIGAAECPDVGFLLKVR